MKKLTKRQHAVLRYLAAQWAPVRLYAADKRIVWALVDAKLAYVIDIRGLDHFGVTDAGRARVECPPPKAV